MAIIILTVFKICQ